MTELPRGLRIVVTGSEGTGKTTLARQLAEHFGAPWVPEHARVYAETVTRPLAAADVEPIARGQIALEDAALSGRPSLLVLDTDLISTMVYARHYYGTEPDWLRHEVRKRLGDLYLLLDTDIVWQPDGIRDRPHVREQIQALFRDELQSLGARVVEVHGLARLRFATALTAVESFLTARNYR